MFIIWTKRKIKTKHKNISYLPSWRGEKFFGSSTSGILKKKLNEQTKLYYHNFTTLYLIITMISLGRLFVLTVQCSQNPSPPGMNDVSVSVLSGRDWLITRSSQHFTQLHTSERKKSADKIISHNSHPGLITGILRTDVSCVRFPALIPATWAKSAVCSGAVLVSTACCKLDKSNLFLSPWPGVFGKSSSLNVCVCCSATIFYPF